MPQTQRYHEVHVTWPSAWLEQVEGKCLMEEPTDATVVAMQVLEREIDDLRSQYMAAGNEIRDCDLRLKSVRTDVESFDHRIETLRMVEAATVAQKQRAQADLDRLESQLDFLTQTVGHLRERSIVPASETNAIVVDDNGAVLLHEHEIESFVQSDILSESGSHKPSGDVQ